MKHTLIKKALCLLCLSFCMTSFAQEHFYQYKDADKSVRSTAMSPNGKYAVGIEYASIRYGNSWETGLGSYVWDLENNTQKWMTVADADNLDNSGSFYDINDKGMIVGFYKDESSKISLTVDGVTATMPINTAALWYDDKRINLGLGTDLKLEDCKKFTNGTVATVISNDGKVIGGNYVVNENSYPCVWKVDAEGNWNYESLPMTAEDGTNVIKGSVLDISADGSVIVGSVYVDETKSDMPAYWTDGKLYIINPASEDKLFAGKHALSRALAVSPNGEYISLQFKKKFFCVYSMSEHAYKKTDMVVGSTNIVSAPVNDNGDAVCTFNCGNLMAGGVYYRPMKFCYKDESFVDLSYIMTVYAPDVKLPFSVEVEDKPLASVASFSNDGLTILGNYDEVNPDKPTFKGSSTWVLRISDKDVKVPQVPTGLKARLSGPKEVTLTWPAVKDENYTIDSYNLFQKGKLLRTVYCVDGTETYKSVVSNAMRGYVPYTISAVYKLADGKLLESPKSNIAEVAVPKANVTSLFEDFDTDSWNNNYWTLYNDMYNVNNNRAWGCLPFMGFISYAGVSCHNMQDQPYSMSAVSQPVDVSSINGDIYFSCAIRKRLFKDNADMTKDSLSIEISSDWGETWKEAAVYTAENLPGTYTFESVNITDYAKGKTIQLRLRAHGQGVSEAQFLLDQISISEEREYTPAGLMASDMQDNKRQIRWKNTYDAYELTYMCNPYGDTDGKTIGNEGKEIIAANLYDPEMLAPFQDKYLTAVTTSLNWYNDGSESKLDASVMIWEGDELVREQSFPVEIFNTFSVIRLDEPLKINAEKPLRVGIKVANYPKTQMPLLFFTTPEYVTTKSDLYSEDGGKTWNTLKDAYADSERPEDGFGTWKISASISDEETIDVETLDNSLIAYNVYRDGEKLNGEMIHALQGCFVENDAPATGDYEVRAYYLDGGVSHISEPLSFVPTSISSTKVAGSDVVYNPETKTVYVNGEFENASVFTLDGMKVMETTDSDMHLTNLNEGVYILNVKSDNSIKSYKLLVK